MDVLSFILGFGGFFGRVGAEGPHFMYIQYVGMLLYVQLAEGGERI